MAELPQIGDSIAARYRVDRSLGVGGMGAVFACTDLASGRPVALKWLKPELAHDATALARFLAEAKRLGGIEHPNVVGVLDAATDPASGAPFLVMEFLRGESLRDRLRRGPLPEAEAVRIALAIARGVAEAHREGVVHRDLKPDNVLLCEAKDGTPRPPKVVDFGIAKLREDDERITRTGRIVGTPAYMAPEQFGGARALDPRLDVYAIGAIVFEMVAGRPAFPQSGIVELVRAITQVGAPPLRTVAPHASAELAALGARAMQRDPALRPPDARALAHELEALATAHTHRRALGEAHTMPVTMAEAPTVAAALATPTAIPNAAVATPPRLTPTAPTARAVAPQPRPTSKQRARGAGLSPVVFFGVLVLGIGALVAAAFAFFVATRARDVRARGPGLVTTQPSGEAPSLTLRMRQSCRSARFAPPLLVRHVGNRLDILSDRGEGISDVLSIDPGTRAQTGVFELSSLHAYHSHFALTLIAAGMNHRNYVARLGEVDPVRGTAIVRRIDPRRGILDLELRGVALHGTETGEPCLVDGRVRTFGLTRPE